jgi:hypothetical protein
MDAVIVVAQAASKGSYDLQKLCMERVQQLLPLILLTCRVLYVCKLLRAGSGVLHLG